MNRKWCKENYEKSVSSRCWLSTPYERGWDGSRKYGIDLSADDELRQIVVMERELGSVPEWAQQIVERSMKFLPTCGHYLFPQPYIEVVSAIGSQTPPDFVHGCYTVERERKKQMMDYVFCLDAWLAGVGPEAAARELTALGYRHIDWHTVCANLWKVLGERTELKELLVERLIHSQRWKIKTMIWDDGLAADFGRDQYLGTLSETRDSRNPAKLNCYIGPPVFGFDEGASPRIQRLEARLAEICPDWGDRFTEGKFQHLITCGWLCAPKAFRYLERLLWQIGKGGRRADGLGKRGQIEDGEKVPGFLQCEDTYPNQDQATEWWRAFCTALQGWWREHPEKGDVAYQVNQRLGEGTPVKRWLVRLFVRRLQVLLEISYDGPHGIARFVNPRPSSKRGTRSVGPGMTNNKK